MHPFTRSRAVAAASWLGAGGITTWALCRLTGAPVVAAVPAVAMVYACGYVTGANVLKPIHDRTSMPLASVRLLAGLFLSSLSFLWSLLVGLPWWVGPVTALLVAIAREGWPSLEPPTLPLSISVRGVLAAILCAVLLSPTIVSTGLMAPGSFPPVFLNVDVPYFLEKVHALVQAVSYPPESLSVMGGSRPYHFGLHGVAALIARGSGLLPHHALFGLLVPLIALGMLAAAVWLARTLAEAVPSWLSVPFLLLGAPTLWYDFWPTVAPRVADAVSTASLNPLQSLAKSWEVWGITGNLQNLCGHFIVLATLGAWLNRSRIGWTLACFLAGSAFAFKSPTGIALLAGLGLAQLWAAVRERRIRSLFPVVAAALVFALVYGSLWVWLPLPAELRVAFQPWFQLEFVERTNGLAYFVWDVAWVVLPALVAWSLVRRVRATSTSESVALLLFALGPFVVVNTFRLIDLRREFGVSSMNEDDWRQLVLAVPIVLHAFALAVVARRWPQWRAFGQSVVALSFLLAVLPPAYVAYSYSDLVLAYPSEGHEFADNRELGQALAAVPVASSVVVTNDLRYPADGFRRAERQMQIPALYGHQAFAVNYYYESYPFSPERRELQALLSAPVWSPAIEAAARTHGWTHLVVRADFAHPAAVPLERLFDNGTYTVYRFPR